MPEQSDPDQCGDANEKKMVARESHCYAKRSGATAQSTLRGLQQQKQVQN